MAMANDDHVALEILDMAREGMTRGRHYRH